MQYFFHSILPKKALSAFMYKISRVENTTFKNIAIRLFMKITGANLVDAARKEVDDYRSLLDFFTRELATDSRLISAEPADFTSPVDGAVAYLGAIENGRIFQIKGHDYALSDLLGADIAEKYQNGEAATLYLAPYDYHRIHMPYSGKLIQSRYIAGELNSVSIKLLDKITGLFARNERVICEFEAEFGQFVMVLVGAVNVGSIETVMHGEITPNDDNEGFELPVNGEVLNKGDELGRFNLGSTVIIITEQRQLDWMKQAQGAKVQLGQCLAKVVGSYQTNELSR